MAKVDANLYEFLKENETGITQRGKEIIAYVHIDFCDLDDFIKIIGNSWFDEGGLEAYLFRYTVCVELNDIFESEDNNIFDYKNCFNEEDIESYSHLLIKKE